MRPGNNDLIKELNTDHVLRLIVAYQPIPRIEISRRSGISRSTVSQIVAELIEHNLVEETGVGDSIGGRRPILLGLRESAGCTVAVHIDDDGAIRGFSQDLRGGEIARAEAVCTDQAELPASLIALVRQLVPPQAVLVCIVLALPGIIDAGTAKILSAVNLGWNNLDLGAPLRREFVVPILAENATGVATLGEKAAQVENWRSLVLINIGTAVGAGILSDGGFYHSLRGSIGEIGHMVVDAQSRVICKCGRRGCLETFLGRGFVFDRIKRERPGLIAKWDLEQHTVLATLAAKADAGDDEAREIIASLAGYTALGLANIANILGPEAIVVQSDLIASDYFWERVHEVADKDMLPVAEGTIKIVRSVLGDQGVMRGLKEMIQNYIQQDGLKNMLKNKLKKGESI